MAALTLEAIIAVADAEYEAARPIFHSAGRETYRALLKASEEALAANLATLFNTTVPELIWRKAWEDGHSEGYYSVAHHYAELAELVIEAEQRAKGL